MTPAPYPLCWPSNLPRPKTTVKSSFRTTLAGALKNIRGDMRLLLSDMRESRTDVVISSNAALGLDRPTDPGVAVWFQISGSWMAFACARYPTPAENLQAIVHVVDARRTELRHVGIEMVRATLHGLAALPPPGIRHWSEVLGIRRSATLVEVHAAYRRLAAERHPDRPGGSETMMSELNVARDAAERSFK